MDPTKYEIRLLGRAERTVCAAFDDLEVHAGDGTTHLVGELDQAGLHSVLERVQRLGLVLLEVRVVHEDDRHDGDGAPT